MHLVGFTGTRAGCTEAQRAAMAGLLFEQSRMSFAKLVHGCCEGADREAHAAWRRHHGVVRFRPGDKRQYAWAVEHVHDFESIFGPMPYLARNRLIVEECAVLVACPGEAVEVVRSGTWSTVRVARRAGKPIYVIRPDGTVQFEPSPIGASPAEQSARPREAVIPSEKEA